jgi:hypothetical protein
MSIREFFNIYRPTTYDDEAVTFIVRQNLIFIWLHGNYSNNKEWPNEFFYVLGEWESSTTKPIPAE